MPERWRTACQAGAATSPRVPDRAAHTEDLAIARPIKVSLCLQLAVIDQVVHALHDGVFADLDLVAPARIQHVPHDSRHLKPSRGGGRQDELVDALRQSAGK